jgi:arylsulfatase A-like enzyme
MKQPDIVFIVLDTQRVDRLGLYGYQAPYPKSSITPNIDRFAEDAAVFDMAISPAQWTIPSHASMFTGLYPSAHQVIQSNRALGPDRPHMAEALRAAGYQTFGFCNNPLVGVLDNGFKRGFDTFYNYGGAIPSVPEHSTRLPWPAGWLLEAYTQFLRRISYPIQNFFGQSDLAFRISLNAWLTPIWSRMANFKGQNHRSVKDIAHFLSRREKSGHQRPLFLFLNLMETHLPFWPPGEFVERLAPYMRRDQEARQIMRRWNREAYRWAAPLEAPLSELETRVLSDMYDAEVAYQDAYLGQLFDTLAKRSRFKDTLTIIVSDHGDGLGEHNYFGHAFVAYQELVHVPLILHWPRMIRDPQRIDGPVSTRRIYHTLLDAASVPPSSLLGIDPQELQGLTLLETIRGRDPERNTAFAEVFSPMNFAKAVQRRQPELIERFRCLATRKAVVSGGHKMIHVDNRPDELFDLVRDPLELESTLSLKPGLAAVMSQEIDKLDRWTQALRENLASGTYLDIEQDEQLLERLRGLGYVE